jgi:hypothetical protein
VEQTDLLPAPLELLLLLQLYLLPLYLLLL